ncbi:MAG: inositol monophosphatase family protein [Synechococcales cyanobacterium]
MNQAVNGTVNWDPLGNPSAVVAALRHLTQQVGSRLIQDFGQIHTTEKQDGSLVTAADQWADDTLRQHLTGAFPGWGLLTEEGSQQFPGDEWCWVIDPLDGTTNFAHGIPIWGISIALLHQGSPVIGVVDFPMLGQFFHGWMTPQHQGAWLNDQPLQPSSAPSGKNELFSFCSRSIVRMAPGADFPAKIRMVGVATYNLLAVGAGIMIGGIEATPKVWDIAAIWVILHAAGCTWKEWGSQPFFPLVPQADYSRLSHPVLVTSYPALVDTFSPFLPHDWLSR